jgi:ribose transport system substrate-binding protein
MTFGWLSGGSRLCTIAGVALVLATVGCGSQSSPSGTTKTYNVDFANVTESGGLAVVIGNGVASAANVAGFKLKRYNNIPDLTHLDPAQTLQNARLMIQDKPDLIIEYNGIQDIGASLGQQFNSAKIPCIAVNNAIPGCAWFNLSNKQAGIDEANVVAPIIKSKGWTADNTVVLLLQAAFAGTEVNDSVRYFYVTLANAISGFDVVSPSDITAQTTKIGKTGLQVDGQANLQASYTAAKNALQTIPANDHIILDGVNDDSVTGGWRAITEAHRDSNSLVASLGSDEASRTQLRTNPSWVAEGEVFPSMWGEYIVAMAAAMLHGTKPPDLTVTPQTVMTKDTVSKYFNPGSDAPISLPPLAPEDRYLAATGVLQKFHNVQGLS